MSVKMLRAVSLLILALPLLGCGTDTADSSTGPSNPQSRVFDCPLESRVFGQAPAISNLDRQQRIIDATSQHRWSAFDIQRMAPTHLGVVALVSGDLETARGVLSRVGIEHVYAWDPTADTVGVDGAGQVQQVLQWLLEPAVRDIRQAYSGIAGYQAIALWQDAGAVLLQWKAPVPHEVTALAGVRPDGVAVIVEPVRYSERDINAGTARVVDAIRARRIDTEWSSASACGDGSGLVVGVQPASLGDRRVELQEQLSDIAGVPVRVIPEEAPVPAALNR